MQEGEEDAVDAEMPGWRSRRQPPDLSAHPKGAPGMVRLVSRFDWQEAEIAAKFATMDEGIKAVKRAELWGKGWSAWMDGRPAGRTGPSIKGGRTCTRRWEDVAGNHLQLRAADAREEVFELRYLCAEGFGKPSLEPKREAEPGELPFDTLNSSFANI